MGKSKLFYAFIMVFGIGLAFGLAKLIVSFDGKKGVRVSIKTPQKGQKEKKVEERETFTILSIPRPIPEAGILTSKHLQAQDKFYWRAMDTLESTQLGVMVTLEYENGNYVALGDVVIPPKPGGNGGLAPGIRLPLARPKLWPKGRIPIMVDSDLQVKYELEMAILELKEKTGVEFVIYRGKNPDYVSIHSHKDKCLSNLGRIGGGQAIWLSPHCKKGEILHELMHTLGFFHEQSRPDRDEYMTIFWANIDRIYWEQFKKIPSEAQHLTDTEFDFDSIMLYPPDVFGSNPELATMAKLNGDLYTANREGLSQLDVEKIIDVYQAELEN